MATYLVGGALVLIVALIIAKMIRDKKNGKSSCGCSGNCAQCRAACTTHTKQT